ncbi:MAG: TlpA disulfide reductase family protein, partial [Jatrophihabitantaceae bacterium]
QIGKLIAAGDRKPVHDFGGSLLSGGAYSLSAYKGKAVVVNFWGTWCGPCTVETPQFAKIYDDYRGRGVSFVGIDVGESGRSEPEAFVKHYRVGYPIVYDETGETALRMGNIRVPGKPFTVLLDKEHRVAGVYAARLAPTDLEPMLNKLAAET